MARQLFPVTNYQLSNAEPVANGYLLISLSMDGNASGNSICAGASAKIPLDQNGNIEGSPLFFPNDQILPSGTSYLVEVFTAQGELVSSFTTTITTGQTFSPPVSVPAGQSVMFIPPTTTFAGQQNGGSGATNGSASSTLSGCELTFTQSGPILNYIWGAQWAGFQAGGLPEGAVVESIYPVLLASIDTTFALAQILGAC